MRLLCCPLSGKVGKCEPYGFLIYTREPCKITKFDVCLGEYQNHLSHNWRPNRDSYSTPDKDQSKLIAESSGRGRDNMLPFSIEYRRVIVCCVLRHGDLFVW